MEWNPQTLQLLSQSFMDMLSLQPELRRRGEKSLSDAADTPNYGVAVLRLVAELSIDEQIRQCAAVNFKNHLNTRWVASSPYPIPDGEKEQIKTLIVPLALSVTPKIQAEISKALAVIGNHEESFAVDEILQQMVIPNVILREEDEELFETKYVEFIRRDMEEGGGDFDTRRRIACELLKDIAGENKEKISTQIRHCLSLFDENPAANWKYKECAIYLVVSLATKKASISTDLVDVETFFRSVIVPELEGQDVNAFPMLKAAALKFFTTFLVLIPKHVVMPLLGDLVRFVRSDVIVVHTYAATCIEKLLLVKDNLNGVLQARYTSTDIDPILEDLSLDLFGALEKAPYLEENHYIMRCIMCLFQITDKSEDCASPWIFRLKKVATEVCTMNPKNLEFNHYLFETIATFVRKACENNPSLVNGFRLFVISIFQMVLGEEVTELIPYAFQLLAQIVDLFRPSVPVPRVSMHTFDDLLFMEHKLWEKAANVPALVLTLQTYLQRAPDEVNSEGRLRHVLEIIFNKLLSSPTTEEEGFHILITVIENYGYGDISEHMNHIWASLFTNLQNNKTPGLGRCVIVFMSLFLVKHGVQTLVDSINSVEANLFHVILDEFWIPNLKTITGNKEVKLCAVASTKLLCESALLLDPSAEELWGKLLNAIVTLLSLPLQEESVVIDDDDFDFVGYEPGSKFVLLRNAGGKKEMDDPLKEIEDPKQFLVTFPEKISSEFSGRFPLVIMRYLSAPNQSVLVKLCNSYNIVVV